jgi:phosphatidylserine/phosphatidylglycerophosphate/cardiolipin synthase-like enzyme
MAILGMLVCMLADAGTFRQNVLYTACFTPEQNCTAEIVAIIDKARQDIFVQAYSFTSRPIIQALVNAADRGVKVFVILDKSNFTGEFYSPAQLFIDHHIAVWNDNSVNIAHNKVIIVDRKIIETGSFNFTHAAQYDNAENVLIIYDSLLAERYLGNWYHRQSVSERVDQVNTSERIMHFSLTNK